MAFHNSKSGHLLHRNSNIGTFPCWSLLLSLCLLPGSQCLADEWFCSEGASRRLGLEIHACGRGSGTTRDSAIASAFQNAKAEFDRVCAASDDCRGRPVSVVPSRTECVRASTLFSCRRMLVFVLHTEAPAPLISSSNENIRARAHSSAKIDIRMSKAEVLAAFGIPDSIIDASTGRTSEQLIFRYVGRSFCKGESCTIVISDGSVSGFNDFQLENTRYLDDDGFLEKLKFW